MVGFEVSRRRDEAVLQGLVDRSPQSYWYYSDLMAAYRGLIYHPGIHTPMPNKHETYRVEGVNAELRHYLARLRRRSRCFSRGVKALVRNVKLFVYAWNRRQRYRQQYPGYPAHLKDFAYP